MKRERNGYINLIRHFPLRKLEAEDDHAMAMKIVSWDSDGKKNLDKGSRQYLEVLVNLITEFEKNSGHRIDTSGVTPGDIVKDLADENGLTLTALARNIEIGQSNLSEMVNGKREWSKKAILGLCQRFSLNPMLFLVP